MYVPPAAALAGRPNVGGVGDTGAVTTEPAAAPATGPVVADWPQLGRVWRSDRPIAVSAILAPLRHGGGDPTFLRGRGGAVVRGLRTPAGLATLELTDPPGRCGGGRPGVGARGGLGAGRHTGPAGRARRRVRVRGAPRPRGRGGAAVHRVAGAAVPAGPRVARTGGHRAEGDRPGGVRGVPAAGPPVRGAGTRPVRVGRAPGAAVTRAVGGDPVVAVPQGVGRPGAVADAGRRGSGGRDGSNRRST